MSSCNCGLYSSILLFLLVADMQPETKAISEIMQRCILRICSMEASNGEKWVDAISLWVDARRLQGHKCTKWIISYKAVSGFRPPPSTPTTSLEARYSTSNVRIIQINQLNRQPHYLIADIYITVFQGNYSGGDPFKRAT